ncbi:hypothetical protein CN213_06065 [Sinorhizobium meliloti]|uniref:hypothetical protein n=1 Tax=Rhizobium meliloti TaxID=382 RepID=UPI000FD6D439|nr:hypothetical protein [Sinorhizobium meliloti]RVH60068.1 hypothetical protein CN213_06065 [Sinorhizobium meliloti]
MYKNDNWGIEMSIAASNPDYISSHPAGRAVSSVMHTHGWYGSNQSDLAPIPPRPEHAGAATIVFIIHLCFLLFLLS